MPSVSSVDGAIRIGDNYIDSKHCSFWHRRFLYGFNKENTYSSNHFEEFAKIYYSLELLCTKSFFLTAINFSPQSRSKIYQLLLAKKLGINVPNTIFSNDYTHIKDTIKNQKLIVKTISGGSFEHNNEKYAFNSKLITQDNLSELKDYVSESPAIYQEYIEKSFELRITIVGNQFFTCKIDSQKSADDRAKIDWRHYKLDDKYWTSHQLPQAIETKILLLMKDLNLNFGCIDMVVTPDGDYVFLEINPNGQWLWIERLTKMPISKAIANILLSRSH